MPGGGPMDFVMKHADELWAIENADGNPPPFTLEDLRDAEKRPRRPCDNCGNPEWKTGSLIVGWIGCFSCIAGEADASDDYDVY